MMKEGDFQTATEMAYLMKKINARTLKAFLLTKLAVIASRNVEFQPIALLRIQNCSVSKNALKMPKFRKLKKAVAMTAMYVAAKIGLLAKVTEVAKYLYSLKAKNAKQ